jgi:hypothetical protein
MKKTIIINIIFLVILILTIFLILHVFNLKYQGVPIYGKLGVTLEDLKSYKYQKKIKHVELDYINYFSKYTAEVYLDNYKKKNQISDSSLIMEKGIDINLFFFIDKNNCRENENENYINSDLVLLGDSYLWGVTINSPFDIAGNLRKTFSKKKIINLGSPGTGPSDQLNLLKTLTFDYEFKKFIWFFYEGNDYQETTIKIEDNNLKKCNFISSNKEVALVNNTFKKNSLLTNSKIFLANHLRGLGSFLKIFKNWSTEFNLNEEHYDITLRDAKNYLDTKKIETRIIYYIPSYTYQAYKKNIKHPQLDQIDKLRSKVREIAIKNGFEFMDGNIFLDSVENRLDLYHYEYPTHFNSLGYKLISDQISEYLEKINNVK